jgi:hypothetical protein
MMNMLDLAGKETRLTFRTVTAQEYHGSCTPCKAGDDYFRFWPAQGRFWMRLACPQHH